MKKLKEILPEKIRYELRGDKEIAVHELYIDSRIVEEGGLFAAIRGAESDGHDYIDQAIANGAKVIVAEKNGIEIPKDVTMVITSDSRKVIGMMAHKFFDNPSDHINVIAITGTNGKTSVAWMVYRTLTLLREKCGLISTIENRFGTDVQPSSLTTPDVISVHRLLHQMVNANCDYVVLEASSHALDQRRLDNVAIDIAVFTNLSRDHLDYHNDMLSYLRCKKILFDELNPDAVAITNIDDKNGMVMVQECKAKIRTMALQRIADYRMRLNSMDVNGMELEVNSSTVFSPLIGDFNIYNLLSVYAVMLELGFENHEVLEALSLVQAPEGRMDMIKNEMGVTKAIIDFAHTPDAIKNVLKVLRDVVNKDQKIIIVLGAGGDRDKGKRPLMTREAYRGADKVILTSDNPRSEDPSEIVEDMLDGLKEEEKQNVLSIISRREAIKVAYALAGEKDIILIVGKGHEKYQEEKGVKVPFDDKVEVYNLLYKES